MIDDFIHRLAESITDDPDITKRLISEEAEPETNDSSFSADYLEECLASAVVLAYRAKAYHWNYVGPSFDELHNVFEEIHNKLNEDVDDLAERVRALDKTPISTLQKFLSSSKVDDGPSSLTDGAKMVPTLLDGFKQYRECLSSGIQEADKAGDEGTLDLLVGMLKEADKTIWMLKSTK